MDRRHQQTPYGAVWVFFTLVTSIISLCHANKDAISPSDYMKRFNIPVNHIHLEWAKTGSGLKSTSYKGKTYKWIPRDRVAGVKAGYATMWDRSSRGYCTRLDAQTDTQKYFGQRLMAVGACPNYGKYIAFVDRNGTLADSEDRFTNEIHGNTMPFSTQGCASGASLGDSEVSMNKSGWTMYSGYMARCPFSQAVYENDMLKDSEYDENVCSFVTMNNPLVFLDVGQKEGNLSFKPYAFHGKGGHTGYDFVGNGVGCPPYTPPQRTRAMKDPSIANDPFLCSQLSRCTNLCWPWDSNRPCYRSLPVSFNHETQECLILGYHTQTYLGSSCAVKSTTDTNAKYCVKAHKTVSSSKYTYLTAFTRPDYQTACPPREPLRDAVFGTLSSGVCTPLSPVKSSSGLAGHCGEAVFNASSDDTPAGGGGSGSSSIYWSSWFPQSSGSSQGTCNLYSTVPTCVFSMTGAYSFTALSAADISLAVSPPIDVVTPGPCSSNPCANGGVCELPTGTCRCPACFTGPRCETKTVGCCASNADCKNSGTCSGNTCTCKAGYSGKLCEIEACNGVKCENGGTCRMPGGKCECPVGFSGSRCEIGACDGVTCKNNGTCSMPGGKCQCPSGFTGSLCETGACDTVKCKNGGSCKMPQGTCTCPAGYSGPLCEISPCDGVVCKNGGTCTIPAGTCTCKAGYSGPRCEIEACSSVACQNGGTCEMPGGTCKCQQGYSGPRCEIEACTGVNCQNGGKCSMPTGTCSCPVCYSGDRCQIPNVRCCHTDEECHTPQGTCNNNSCQCLPSITGDKCDNAGCSGVTCLNGGRCEDSTGRCTCPLCYSGANCETHKSNCCANDSDCNEPNGSCTSKNTCQCKSEFQTPNCEDTCSGVSCEHGGTCDAATGNCICPPGWGGSVCSTPGPCGNDGICSGNKECDSNKSMCVCKPGYTGSDCNDHTEQCKEVCQVGGDVVHEYVDECSLDCYSTCCKHVMNSCDGKKEDDLVQCLREEMKKKEDEQCCLTRLEEGSNTAMYAMAGVLGILLLAGVAGGAYYKSTAAGALPSGPEPELPEEQSGGHHRPTRTESAISVNFEDYASTPDDDGSAALDAGETTQEAVWDEEEA